LKDVAQCLWHWRLDCCIGVWAQLTARREEWSCNAEKKLDNIWEIMKTTAKTSNPDATEERLEELTEAAFDAKFGTDNHMLCETIGMD